MEQEMKKTLVARIVMSLMILGVGFLGYTLLVMAKEPVVKAERKERAIRVELQVAKKIDTPVIIHGFGEARARDVVNIAAEVPGRVMQVHPRLELGEVISKGEVLFVIDDRDYTARLDDAQATVSQLESALDRLTIQHSTDTNRLQALTRSYDLAEAEYLRTQRLFQDDQVVTLAQVDRAEIALNAAKDAVDQLEKVVNLYPVNMREAESSLIAAKARARLAEANLDRATVRAPFNARIKSVNLEVGQYVSPGINVLTLADDSLLEISVSLNSREARNWLEFDDDTTNDGQAWFNHLRRVPVEISWTEGGDASTWTGILHRVERFDQQTRTLTVAVQIQGSNALSSSAGHLPLVEGMFCRVAIPGKTAENVVKVPAEAVGFDRDASGYRNLYLAVVSDEGQYRLHTIEVKESHLAGEYIFITEGIENGDEIVVTRLVNPLENSLLVATNMPHKADAS